MTKLTQQTLMDLLDYIPDTGVFLWKTATDNHEIGDFAGTPDGIGYLKIYHDYNMYFLHRLAILYITGAYPVEDVDHIDGDKLNNRLCNLRACSTVENSWNRTKNKNNTSGFKGVSFDKGKGKFAASHHKHYVKIHIGYYATAEEASEAYKSATAYRGEFNPPTSEGNL